MPGLYIMNACILQTIPQFFISCQCVISHEHSGTMEAFRAHNPEVLSSNLPPNQIMLYNFTTNRENNFWLLLNCFIKYT